MCNIATSIRVLNYVGNCKALLSLIVKYINFTIDVLYCITAKSGIEHPR